MTRDRVVGAVFVLLGILALIFTLQIPLEPGSEDPGSRLFPMIGSWGMILFGFGTALFAKGQDGRTTISLIEAKRLIGLFAVFVLCIVSMYFLGFLITAPFVMYALITMFSYEKKVKWTGKVLFSVVSTLLIWLLFVKVLSVILPTGKLF